MLCPSGTDSPEEEQCGQAGKRDSGSVVWWLGGVPGWWHGSPWGSPWSPAPPEMPKGRRRPVLSLRLWLSRRSMRPTRMI